MPILRGRLALLRILVPTAYLALAGAVFFARGVPLDRGMLVAWILGALLCLSLGSLISFIRSVLLEWLPLLAALTLYDVLRGVGGGRVPIHGEFQIWLDRHVFGFGSVPTVWLQQHLFHANRISTVDRIAFATYMSYFFVTPVALGGIWLLDRRLFRRYARQLALLAFAAVAFFTACPTIPPWLAAQKQMIGGSAQRLIGVIGLHMGYWDPTPLWERGVRLANDLAAFPSLHEAMTILLSVVLWRRVPRVVRPLLVAYPLLMAFSLVYLGEHYVADLVAGAVLVAAVCAAEPRLLGALQARLARRRVAAEAAIEPA
ncbi:MAG TPA: phosphatase PAP2 family protein [Gaiellaceae bacterium]|nr:phosphatase PAP2 family protein [Gaiellaceae bacterium]